MNSRVITAADVVQLESRVSPDPIVGLSFEFPSGGGVEPHTHQYGQLVFGSSGVMCVDTPAGSWVVPPQRAVWIPPGTIHQVKLRSAFSMRNLLISVEHQKRFPAACSMVVVSNLLRELILRATEEQNNDAGSDRFRRIIGLIFDEIAFTTEMAIQLRVPSERRVRRICEELQANPADRRTLDEWSAIVGASARTLSRLFLRETGMTFEEWRRQVKLQEALYRLGVRQPIGAIAADLGYESTTGFIDMFRKTLGRTPGQYYT